MEDLENGSGSPNNHRTKDERKPDDNGMYPTAERNRNLPELNGTEHQKNQNHRRIQNPE